jgi:lysophospholipase L1-like esterase
MSTQDQSPDPHQGHTREWPSTPYSDEARTNIRANEPCCIVGLFGDCTVECSYFPLSNRPQQHLVLRLRRAFSLQKVKVHNFAADGETAARFLSNRAASVLADVPQLNVAFIRYGINDRKEDGVSQCIENLRALCSHVQKRYPTVRIIIETGLWVDYPRHYLWDRNSRLQPLYAAMKDFASKEGFALLDIFSQTQRETLAGNWDLRIRGLPAIEHQVVDDSFDQFFGDDPAFFTNIHPNSRCLALVAEWETEMLKQFYNSLPQE